MNKICKEYISEIKALFPIKRKPEKDYIKKIAADVADYCEDDIVYEPKFCPMCGRRLEEV